MTFPFTAPLASQLGPDPARVEAAGLAAEIGAPDTAAEGWRYSPVADLAIDALRAVTEMPSAEIPSSASFAKYLEEITAAATVTIVDGFITSLVVAEDWAKKGLAITADPFVRPNLPEAPTLFDHLHTAFAPDGLRIEVAAELIVDDPIIIRSHLTAAAAAFCSQTITVANDAEVTVVEHITSDGAGLMVGMSNFVAEDRATLHHTSIQDMHRDSWQVGRMFGSAADFGRLDCAMVAFGGTYARVRTDVDLNGRAARGDLVGVYFGDGDQVLDFRTFQHHRARDTVSDLLFKGTVDNESGSVYTGMIHIHPDGAGSNAFQTNRNIKLGDDSWAWSVPNLQIENNEVRCSHASTVSPVDPAQRFYLHSRGVPPSVADRLIVAGFYEETLRRIPVEGAAAMTRSLISEKLDKRMAIK